MTLRTTDDDTWREKYPNALDAHDALERQADDQYQRLRRALVQLSIVADGQDRQLDELLDELRKTLRGDQGEQAGEEGRRSESGAGFGASARVDRSARRERQEF